MLSIGSFTTQQVVTATHWSVAGLLALAALAFIALFWIPGFLVGREMRRATKTLRSIKSRQGSGVLDLEAVQNRVMVAPALRHCWVEFRDTLHGQQTLSSSGQLKVSRWRATAAASSFFTDAALIDTRLRTEFFKHLPGILTGLGIIGTFSGLILGLIEFQVSDDATTVRRSLQALLSAVGGAFAVSAAAIGTAMLVTLVEKIVVSRRYAELEQLCGAIDSLFESGAGEEYLARLVQASETQATQALQIKDALVSDLKNILTELTERQVAAATASNAQLGQNLSQSLTDSLSGPLQQISGAVQQVAASQGDAINRMLTDVLASFAGRMETMFGGQLGGINELLKQTADAMQATAARFDTLAGRIQEAGADAAERMATRMEAMMQTMGERQAETNAQMSAFVQQLRKMVADGQSETAELMQSTFAELSEVAGGLARQLESQARATTAEVQRSTQALASHTGEAINQQGQQIAALAGAVEAAAKSMQESVATLRAGVDDNVAQLGGSAQTLLAAASKMEGSLGAMTNAAEGVNGGIEDLTDAARQLKAASTEQLRTLAEHQQVRDAVGKMVTELRAIVDTASRDASMNARLVTTLEQAAAKLVEAQGEAGTYLEQVSDVLGQAHQSFADSVAATLRRGNAEFQRELGAAVDVLRGAIQDLGDTLDAIPSNRH